MSILVLDIVYNVCNNGVMERRRNMELTIELTDTEYVALQHALKHATYAITPQVNDTDRLELLHLITLLAQATEGQ